MFYASGWIVDAVQKLLFDASGWIVDAVQRLLFDASGWIVDAATELPGVDVEILGDSDCNDPGDDSTPKQN